MNVLCLTTININVNSSNRPKKLWKIFLLTWFAGWLLVIIVSHNLKYSERPSENADLPPAPVNTTDNAPASNLPASLPISAPSKPLLPGIAVIDTSRILAAHPWTAAQADLFKRKLAEIPPGVDDQTRIYLKDKILMEQRLSRELVVRDVQRIIAAYATTHGLKLVLDRSAKFTNGSPAIFYSLNPSITMDFQSSVSGPGVKDITQQVLHKLAQEGPGMPQPSSILQP
jgi:hypothetical protein